MLFVYPFGKKRPFYKQSDAMDCGPSCLRMVAEYHGKKLTLNELRKSCFITKQGVTFSGLSDAAASIGFKVLPAEVSLEVLREKVPLPCILHWNKKHFVVLYAINRTKVFIADPAVSKMVYPIHDFLKNWQIPGSMATGRAILLEPTPAFHQLEAPPAPRFQLLSVRHYMQQYKKTLYFVIATLLLGSLLTLIPPFLTQTIVDKGIRQKNVSLIQLIALALGMLFLGRIAIDILRARLLFYLGTRLNITVLTGFLSKLMLLPLPFFDTRNIGDNMQRMMDHHKVEEFVTNSLINILLAGISVLIFGSVLLYYSWLVFLIFLTGSALALTWALSWTPQRKILDHLAFRRASESQNLLIETITAIQEIKLTGYEQKKLEQWQQQQEIVYQTKLDSLKLDQRILSGVQVCNECKNILITCVAATQVVSGQLTMGMMLAIAYIAGQLNAPVLQFGEFIRTRQNARFSLKRMEEVLIEENEDAGLEAHTAFHPQHRDIVLRHVSFRYGGSQAPLVLKDLSLTIPAGKITAIVGMSGSGKTTLIRLLLKFYQPTTGQLYIGTEAFSQLPAKQWRQHCGVVMQDGFIFSDTICNNICAGNPLDPELLHYAATMANIHAFISELPFGYDTVIGRDGHGLSEGQIQRVLIARLIYRKPDFIFLDEATNSLDANNEKVIIQHLQHFFKGKTVVIVAHRLSTVKNADQIVVLDKGSLLEKGTHDELISARGAYFNLIRNQLELGK